MKLSIEQLRDVYRKSTNKDEALQTLAASEGVSVSTIKLYVRGVMSSVELEDMAVANGTVEATIPAADISEEASSEIKKTLDAIPTKKRGRPVKNLKPARDPATPREEKPAKKALVRARPVDVILPMASKPLEIVEVAPDPVDGCAGIFFNRPSKYVGNGAKPEPAQVTQTEKEMFFADISDEGLPMMTAKGLRRSIDELMNAEIPKPSLEPVIHPAMLPFITPEQLDQIKAKVIAQSQRNIDIKVEEFEAHPKAMTHMLKCEQPYFDDIWEGYKSFEVRLNDREYESGDSVLLIAYNPEHSIYETRQIFANIGYLLHGDDLPGLLDKETVVFSLINIKRYELQEVGV